MTENILKNEIIQEEQDKKKSKNKLYSALAIIIIAIGAGTGLGTYFGLHHHHNSISTPIVINLNTLVNQNIIGTEALMNDLTGEEVLKIFLNNNADYSDLENNVEIISWIAPTYVNTGSLVLTAIDTNSKYTGTITINIMAIGQINITQLGLNTNTAITYTDNMSTDEAWNAFVANNSNIIPDDLKDNVNLNISPPTYTNTGSLTISGINKYTGTMTVTIKQLNKLVLEELRLNTNIGIALTDDNQKAAQAFLDANNSIFGNDLTLSQVELTNFQGINIGQNGTLTITVTDENSKYTGTIDIILKLRLDDESIITVMTYLSDNNGLNWQILAGTKQENLMADLTEDFRAKMSNYYVYANDIESIDVTTPRYMPTQTQLNTRGTVWTPPKHTDQQFFGISYLYLGFTVTYKDGTIKEPSEGPVDSDGYHHSNSVLIAWNLNATITMI